MGLRLGQVKWVVGEWSCLSSLFWFLWKSMGAQGVSPWLGNAGSYVSSLFSFEQSHLWVGLTGSTVPSRGEFAP